MTADSLFSRIIRKEIPSDMVYQDELVTAFRDINPQAPVHILIVPNKEIPSSNDVTEADEPILGRMMTVARKLAHEEGIDATGYRLLVNCGEHGHQEVLHLHMHLIGGRDLGRMVGRPR